ncbi:MAG: hypothetical protein KF784_15595 [Fimbriimonadaceae bacterium]|nr:hypothetical protein [Fimbriimonadaceae bacterium]
MPRKKPLPQPKPCNTNERDQLADAMNESDPETSRRTVLKGAAGGFLALGVVQPGELLRITKQQNLVPVDKKRSKEWQAMLRERGKPTVVSGEALDHIGMPVGGICCGQLYLSGDGRLWCWDIFNLPNKDIGTIRNGANYAKPMKPGNDHNFGVFFQGDREMAELSRKSFSATEFIGRYPIGQVRYSDPAESCEITLEAFSPFIPLNTDDSGIPCTILSYKVTNKSQSAKSVTLGIVSNNPVARRARTLRKVELVSDRFLDDSFVGVQFFGIGRSASESSRPDILFDDFESETYTKWKVEGTAFGAGPVEHDKMPDYMGAIGGQGKRSANTHHWRAGGDVVQADQHVGKLTSIPFTIERNYITFLIGGGNHPGKTCVNLLVDGKQVRTIAGPNSNLMRAGNFDVKEFMGKQAVLEVVDNERGGWGQISIDHIVFSDQPRLDPQKYEDEPDAGSFAIAVLSAHPNLKRTAPEADGSEKLLTTIDLRAGETQEVTFAVAWHFPNPDRKELGFLQDIQKLKRHYAKRFKDAKDVVAYVATNFDRLAGETRKWVKTWYEDSTLPHWFLERTFMPTSILASQTCYRFDNDRFYGWEGIYCCAGTCTHVWQYAQAVGRVFPALERDLRARADYTIGFHESGALGHRGEAWQSVAHDGQCGTIMRVYREHTMSADSAFLRRIWPRVKKSIEYMIGQDLDDDGILEGAQFNTLDATWYGPMAWISSLYCGALRAGEAMASEMGDTAFSAKCRRIADSGMARMTKDLYNGEYFIHKLDPNHPETNATGNGCHADQAFGQSYMWQLGLPRVQTQSETVSALKSLYKYNFCPDIGPYRENNKNVKGGRWFAMPGEAGLLVCTWPHGGSEIAVAKGADAWAAMYFNECWTGFEYQVAGHMLYEGLVDEGLTITKTVDDRYSAARRNPYNEIECSDHYARAMASYGVYNGALGFKYHGPKGELSFSPAWGKENFKAAFIAAEGWGSYEQRSTGRRHSFKLTISYGKLRLSKLSLPASGDVASAKLTVNGKAINASMKAVSAGFGEATFLTGFALNTGDVLAIEVG